MGGIIVVADTHFGIKKGSISMPGYFADFLWWIKELEKENEQKVKILDRGTIKDKTLIKPNEIIFLGDIIELWDSEDEAVNTCVSTLMPTLAEIEAEKIYVLGNHDNILDKALLSQEKEYYPLGESNLKIVEEYPSEGFMKKGDQNYLFVHGHQFDKHFTNIGKLYNILPALRNVSNALTNYVPFLFFVSLALAIIDKLMPDDIFSSSLEILDLILRGLGWFINKTLFLGKPEIVVLLLLLTIPKIYMTFGRRFWSWFSGVKYKKHETIDNFTKWWKLFIGDNKVPENLNVVYGHTHFLNYIPKKKTDAKMYQFYMDKLRDRKISVETRPAIVNISAWMKDIKNKEKDEKYKNVMVASFLYIDDEGFEFFGWDWYEKSVFHIPKEVIIIRRELEKNAIPEDMAKKLAEIGWPKKLIEKWQKSAEF